MKNKLCWLLLSMATAMAPGPAMAATNDNPALWRPRFATPAIVALDSSTDRQFTAEIRSSAQATGWSAQIANDLASWNCQIVSSNYGSANINRGTEAGWQVVISVPTNASPELFALIVTNNEKICVQSNAVNVIPAFNASFYILHVTDEQIVNESPHHTASGQWYSGSTGSQEQLYWPISIYNLINPRFVMETGDLIDFNACIDGSDYNNWSNWGYVGQPHTFTTQETYDISLRLTHDYINAHMGVRVPFVTCPGNHDVPPPNMSWHTNAIPVYETNFGQRSWSFRMNDFYVLMHDWSDSTLRTWANNDYTNALNDPTVKYRLVGQHNLVYPGYTIYPIQPSGVSLMLMGHTHATSTYQTSPYYIYVDTASFYWGGCGFFNFNRTGNTWTCDQTTSPRNTATDCWPLYTDNGVTNKVRASVADPFNITTGTVTITNDLPKNFYDGRVRFLMPHGTYNYVTNGTMLSQYDCWNGAKTAVLVKVNIPASGTIKVSVATTVILPPPRVSETVDPGAFGSQMKISFAGYNRTTVLSNFPVLVTLSTNIPGFSYRQFASPAGVDLRFCDDSGTAVIPHEIDEWSTNGISSVWVQIPQLASAQDYIWAYWGNPSLAQSNAAAWTTNGTAWRPDYEMVLHLKESGFPYLDSLKQYSPISGSAPASTAAGMIGRACVFNGSSQYLNGDALNLGDTFTISAWIKLDPAATNIQTIWANKPAGWNANGAALFVNSYNTSDKKLLLETGDGTLGKTASTDAGAVSYGQWHHVLATVSRPAGTAKLYVDGVDHTVAGAIQSTLGNDNTFAVGRLTGGNYYFNGTIDEVRVETNSCSPDEAWAHNTIMNSAVNGSFLTYSALPQPAPALGLTSGGNGLLLSWSGTGVGFALCGATNLAGPWIPVAGSPVYTNGQWQAAAPGNSSSAQFYRLQGQ